MQIQEPLHIVLKKNVNTGTMRIDFLMKMTLNFNSKFEIYFNCIFVQSLATTVKLMLTFEFGVCLAFSGIIIAALGENPNQHNVGEFLQLTDSQKSWLGSVIYICEPIGSIFSAIVTGN